MDILIVDDKQENRYLLETLLKGNGHDVETADNGTEALDKLKSGKIELIISDILMPVMDGFQLCRKVKTDESLRHIPFIIYTATYTGPKDEELALKIGADRFIAKPCEPDVFMDNIRDVMASARANALNTTTQPQEEELLRLYNERLVRKLEHKMLQLEKEVQARQAADEIVRQNEKKYKSLFNSIRDAILVSDTNRMIIDCNPAFAELFGYSLEEIAGEKTCIVYEKEEDFEKLGNALNSPGGDSSLVYTINFRKKNGTIFPGELTVFYLRDEAGGLTGFIGFIRDISEQKNAEKEKILLTKQLQQSQKMESIGTLAGGIAHDFNNILSAVIGYTELALDRVEQETKVRDYLKEVFYAAQRAKDLVKQILAFARQSDDEIKSIRVDVVIKEVMKLLRSSIPATIEIRDCIESNSMILGNPTQVHQILMNLCTNAAHAMENDIGVLGIGLTDVFFDGTPDMSALGLKPGNYIEIKVSDTGAGIRPDMIESIFEPYFTTKAAGVGTGLGLSTVHGIVESYGGRITVDSTLGKGTVFTVYLPITQKQSSSHSYEPEKLPKGNERILFVDDEVQLTKLSAKILHELGYLVKTRTSSTEALELFRAAPDQFDLVITDMTMPHLTGDKLALEVMKIRPDIPVILCTGYSNKISEENVSAIGINALLNKPVAREALAAMVRKVLDENKIMKNEK